MAERGEARHVHRLVGVRVGGDHRDDGMHFGGRVALAVGHQHVFVVALVHHQRLAHAREQVDDGRAAELEVLGVQVPQRARGPVELEHQVAALPAAQARAQVMQVEEMELARKREVLLQQAVGGLCVGGLRQHLFAFGEADLAPCVGRQHLQRAAFGHDADRLHARHQRVVQRHGEHPVALQVNAQVVDLELGEVGAGVALEREPQYGVGVDGGMRDAQRPQHGVPGGAEAAFARLRGLARRGMRMRGARIQHGVARHAKAGRDLALRRVERELRHRHRGQRLHQRRAEVVEQRVGDVGKFLVEVSVHARRKKGDRFDQPLGMRVQRFAAVQREPGGDLGVALGEVRPLSSQVGQFALVVLQQVAVLDVGHVRRLSSGCPACRAASRSRRGAARARPAPAHRCAPARLHAGWAWR